MQTEPHIEPATESSGAAIAERSPTAGETLSEARARLGLSEKEVADRLHITMHYVKALESDSYEKLPGAVFAKGYIRSYALLLGLDAQEVIARYDEHTSQQKADIEEASRANARRKRDRNKPFVIVSLVVFVGGSLGLWLVNSYFGEEPVANAPPLATANSDSESQATAPVSQIAQVPQTQPQLSLDVEPEQQVEPAAVSAPAITAPSEPQAAAVADSADSAAGPQDALDTDASSAVNLQDFAELLQSPTPEPTSRVVPVVERGPRVIAVEASGNDVLRISFSGESWVEVNDSESEQIYRDIREAGDILEITGSAPFNILLGDAPFTHMSLNGNEIDLSSDIRIDNSARLTVGL